MRQMIRELTTLLEDLLDQVRDRASRADDRAEQTARRIFRRGRPRPGTDAGAPAALAFGAESAASIAAPATPADTTTLADQLLAGPAIASPAGFVSRVIALAIDTWLLSVSGVPVASFCSPSLERSAQIASGIDLRAAVPAAMGALATVLYFIVCWAAFGRTLGMALMGLKALTWDGKRVSLLRAVLRYVGYLISVCFVFVGLLWVLIRQPKTRLARPPCKDPGYSRTPHDRPFYFPSLSLACAGRCRRTISTCVYGADIPKLRDAGECQSSVPVEPVSPGRRTTACSPEWSATGCPICPSAQGPRTCTGEADRSYCTPIASATLPQPRSSWPSRRRIYR